MKVRFGLPIFLVVTGLFISGCFSTPLDPTYQGPEIRPASLEEYYAIETSFTGSKEELLRNDEKFELKRIGIETAFGLIVIDYYARYKKSDDLIFVFPILGGKNIIADYFAEYFANHGFDTAIVHRNDDFKKAENFFRTEEVLRRGIVRDRIAIDYFEKTYGKRDFGTFGISRGAINVAMAAGVDQRLKFNVMALGASDIAKVMELSNQRGVKRYFNRVKAAHNLSDKEIFTFLQKEIKTDPKNLAAHIDARKTLLFLSLFDRTVPIKYGNRLKETLGNPKTIYLFADHYVSLLFTQYVKLLPAGDDFALFPFDFIERESLEFYRESFGRKKINIWRIPFKILKAPFDVLGGIISRFF